MSSAPEPVMGRYGDKRKLCARIDLKNASIVNDVNVEDTITVMVKGKVTMLRGTEEGTTNRYVGDGKEKKVQYKEPGVLELDITSVTISADGTFDGMLE